MKPLPSHAISLWSDGNSLNLRLASGHEVQLPLRTCGVEGTAFGPLASQRGWAVLLDILADNLRHANSASKRPPIGLVATPVRYDVEKWLKAGGLPKRPKAKPAASEVQLNTAGMLLRKLGMI